MKTLKNKLRFFTLFFKTGLLCFLMLGFSPGLFSFSKSPKPIAVFVPYDSSSSNQELPADSFPLESEEGKNCEESETAGEAFCLPLNQRFFLPLASFFAGDFSLGLISFSLEIHSPPPEFVL
jgi:hypothetical protein